MNRSIAQRLLNLATGSNDFTVQQFSHFDYSDVITSEPYSLSIDGNGAITERQLFFKILNEGGRMFGLSLFEMPMEVGEQYQTAVRIPTVNYFERTIENLPIVLKTLEQLGYEWDMVERIKA